MSEGMKCRLNKPGDEKKFTVYTSESCGACKRDVPLILNLAQLYGFTVELVDVNSEDPVVRKRVQHVRWMPHIEYLGLEVTFDELVEVFRNFNRGVAVGVDRPAEGRGEGVNAG
jgi:thiol-disulfide isomerase/thioredoxin